MTDPRIEAAARSIWMDAQDAGAEIAFENASTVNRAMALSLARNALAAADAAAWRHVMDRPSGPVMIMSQQGGQESYAIAEWDKENYAWRGEDMMYSPRFFTHWQPLPAPPKEGGGGGVKG